jgi:hypothetical protein
MLSFIIVFGLLLFFIYLWITGAYTIFDWTRRAFRKNINEIEVTCPRCQSSNFWPDCINCNSSSYNANYQGNTLISVECKNCKQYYHPPIKCHNCNANLNGKLFS